MQESTHEATNGNNAVKSDWDEPSSGNTESSTGDAFLQYQGHVEDSPRAGMPAGASPGDVHDSEEMQVSFCWQKHIVTLDRCAKRCVLACPLQSEFFGSFATQQMHQHHAQQILKQRWMSTEAGLAVLCAGL